MKTLYLTLLVFLLPIMLFSQSPNGNWTFHQLQNNLRYEQIAEDLNGLIVVGGWHNTLGYEFRTFDGNSWTYYNHPFLPDSFYIMGSQIGVDTNNLLWFASATNLFSWDGANLNVHPLDSIATGGWAVAVTVGLDNKIWTTGFQIFDGINWSLIGTPYCNHGGFYYKAYTTSNGDVWFVSSSYPMNLQMDEIPAVFQISNNQAICYSVQNGDNLPLADNYYDLGQVAFMGELSDGTIICAGVSSLGLQVKKFVNGIWDDWLIYNGSGFNYGLRTMIVDENDNLLFGGGSSYSSNSILLKYCNGNWTPYYMPVSNGFPGAINAMHIDRNSNLWIAGDTAVCSIPYNPNECLTTVSTYEPSSPSQLQLTYSNNQLTILGAQPEDFPLNYSIYDLSGQLVSTGVFNSNTENIKEFTDGIYFVSIERKDTPAQTFKLFIN